MARVRHLPLSPVSEYCARRMPQRKQPARPEAAVNLGAILTELKQRLERDGAVKRSELKPKSAQAELIAGLVAQGFESTKTWVRRPVRAQLADALAHAALIPVSGLASHVRGAAAAELKAAVAEAVRSGTIRKVLRGKAEVLCGSEVKVLQGEQLARVGVRAQALSKLIEKVTKKGDWVLLAEDVEAALGELQRALPGKVEPGPDTKGGGDAKNSGEEPGDRKHETFVALLAAVDSTRDGRSGLSFVPAIVGRLAPQIPAEQAMHLLLAAAAQELLELRPEGGIGRLSEAELSVCPPGPHGTKLSWARRLERGAK